MKKFIEILEEIKQTREAVKAAEAKEKALINSYMKLDNSKNRIEKKRAVKSEITENGETIKNCKIAIKILKNNAKIALFNEVMPVALEVLKKYSGKPYGEKTKQKISDEVKAAANCRFYISSRWSEHSFDLYPVGGFGNDYNISCGTKYTDGSRKSLLIDNKIQLVTFDELELYYISPEYVEDVPQRVEAIKAAHAEAVAKQKELKAACDRFNALAVGDINHLYYYEHIYSNMDI